MKVQISELYPYAIGWGIGAAIWEGKISFDALDTLVFVVMVHLFEYGLSKLLRNPAQ